MRRRLGILGLLTGFVLGCSGFGEEFEKGMQAEARTAIDETRDLLTECPEGKPRTDLEHIVDRIEQQLDGGEMSGTEAIFALGMVEGGIEDGGCDAKDAEEIGSFYPDLVR